MTTATLMADTLTEQEREELEACFGIDFDSLPEADEPTGEPGRPDDDWPTPEQLADEAGVELPF